MLDTEVTRLMGKRLGGKVEKRVNTNKVNATASSFVEPRSRKSKTFALQSRTIVIVSSQNSAL